MPLVYEQMILLKTIMKRSIKEYIGLWYILLICVKVQIIGFEVIRFKDLIDSQK